MEGNKTSIHEKFPRIVIMKVTSGFMVGIFPENRDMQKLLSNYMKEVMSALQGLDGEEWKTKMQNTVDAALKEANNDNIKIYACKDVMEVMQVIAPLPEGETPKAGKPNLAAFWSETGYIPD